MRDTLLEAQAGGQSEKYIILQGTLCDIGTRVRFPMGRVQNSQVGSGDQPRRRQIRGPASPDPGQEARAATEKDRWKVMCRKPQRSRSGPWFSCSVVSNSCDPVD